MPFKLLSLLSDTFKTCSYLKLERPSGTLISEFTANERDLRPKIYDLLIFGSSFLA